MKISEEEFRVIVATNNSIADVLRALNLKIAGGNYATVRNRIKDLGITTNHFYQTTRRVPPVVDLSIKLVRSRPTNSTALKRQLIKAGLLEEKCYACLRTEWEDGILPLELDHIDGDKDNNELVNLRILCANCHGQTPTYRGKNIGRYGRVAELVYAEGLNPSSKDENLDAGSNPVFPTKLCGCGKIITKNYYLCNRCSRKPKIAWPPIEYILERLKTTSYVALGKELGVSDNAIRKHLKPYRN